MASSYLLWWRASVSCRHDFVNDKPARAEVNRLVRAFDNSCVFPNTVLTKFAKRVEAAAGGVTSSLLVFRDVIAGVVEEKLAAHEARIQESIIAKVAASETQVNEASAWVIDFTVASGESQTRQLSQTRSAIELLGIQDAPVAPSADPTHYSSSTRRSSTHHSRDNSSPCRSFTRHSSSIRHGSSTHHRTSNRRNDSSRRGNSSHHGSSTRHSTSNRRSFSR
ncbi:hypothetical protein F442_20987 [Phytophthora nicotianae P10297]|uniref:Uncharacterized protein n=3 Tax=Phytophthora nicotianae TaxID=4792 RepID=W2Y474_PHYNI|nr:hypothetical protein L916_20448 [Phytophthora nicotianae]ETM32220.1 hypothetical protein L914_20324 [Phytophthora nicotianae]ETO60644.1 hypothetical protein F444_21186 [Phytophthora nicotianae P1976]ETP29915.1 hypothetical protein F442_20987 [Phytophthora nicotianae P10297]